MKYLFQTLFKSIVVEMPRMSSGYFRTSSWTGLRSGLVMTRGSCIALQEAR